MRIVTLAPTTLESSTVAGSTYDEYNPATTYAEGANVKVTESNGYENEYESLVADNEGNTPATSPSSWLHLGASNKYRMFDDYANTQTEDTVDIDVSVDSTRTDLVGLFRLVGSSVTLQQIYDSAVVAETTIDLRELPQPGWFNWLYSEYEFKEDIVWQYPRYVGSTLSVEITATGGAAACGKMSVGKIINLGATIYGVSIGIDDYSIKDTDSFGRTFLKQGNYAERANIQIILDNSQVDRVKRQLTKIRGTPCIFDCNEEGTHFESLIIYGFYRNFDVTIPGPSHSQCNIEIGGLI